MEQATTVFVAGVLGVFVGMTLIYASIIITSKVADYFEPDEEIS